MMPAGLPPTMQHCTCRWGAWFVILESWARENRVSSASERRFAASPVTMTTACVCRGERYVADSSAGAFAGARGAISWAASLALSPSRTAPCSQRDAERAQVAREHVALLGGREDDRLERRAQLRGRRRTRRGRWRRRLELDAEERGDRVVQLARPSPARVDDAEVLARDRVLPVLPPRQRAVRDGHHGRERPLIDAERLAHGAEVLAETGDSFASRGHREERRS